MYKKILLWGLGTLFPIAVSAQPNYRLADMQTENLNRGLVALRQADGKVALSWRILPSDRKGEPFYIYRNGRQLTTTPLTHGGSFWVDSVALRGEAVYEVKGGGKNGRYVLKANAPVGYLPIQLQRPMSKMIGRNGQSVEYVANDASVGDVDGDGEYEIFLKWEPSNAADNSRAGLTERPLIDCYRLDGTLLWRIDLGKNIRAGAHYTQFMVADFDGDGKAELMMKTADGTIDGQGKTIGDATKDWRSLDENQPAQYGRVMNGPEYLTVFEGSTGKALQTVPYVPERGDVRSWGDDHANRSERYLAAMAYLDGRHPSAVFCRGYYTRTVLAAWDWNGKELKQRWVFDTNNAQWKTYAGQGNHNLRVADVDGDGKDEITYGSMCVDDDGTGLYNTGFGHGDAMHLVADPKTGRLYIWDCHENREDGSDFRDAATGQVVFQKKAHFDVGRAMAADIDPTNYGVELWSANTGGLLNIKGERVLPKMLTLQKSSQPTPTAIETDYSDMRRSHQRLSCNFGIWWDGDLLRELLDHERVGKYNWNTGMVDELVHFEGKFNNYTKSTPCLSADILGDWREEVLIRNEQSTELRLYVSTIPTDYRIDCLMTDIPYRESVAAENVAYNQPPELGYYLGPDATDYLK